MVGGEHERFERFVGSGPFIGESIGVDFLDREVLVPRRWIIFISKR